MCPASPRRLACIDPGGGAVSSVGGPEGENARARPSEVCLYTWLPEHRKDGVTGGSGPVQAESELKPMTLIMNDPGMRSELTPRGRSSEGGRRARSGARATLVRRVRADGPGTLRNLLVRMSGVGAFRARARERTRVLPLRRDCVRPGPQSVDGGPALPLPSCPGRRTGY